MDINKADILIFHHKYLPIPITDLIFYFELYFIGFNEMTVGNEINRIKWVKWLTRFEVHMLKIAVVLPPHERFCLQELDTLYLLL